MTTQATSSVPARSELRSWIDRLPKAELHLHIEGTLEPAMLFDMAGRHGLTLPYADVDALRAAYDFGDLQAFLDLYYAGADALRTEQDFHDLCWAYLQRAHADGVVHVEPFFDPQTHTARGIAFETVLDGLESALQRGQRELGISYRLILCFLRHLSEDEAIATLEQARPHAHRIHGVGLDSGERGNPPSKFARVFEMTHALGWRRVAHAGEEGPAEYVREALDVLHVERVDHGVRSEDNPDLVQRLVRDQVPLTMCPLSNVKLRVFDRLEDHNLKRLLEAGVKVTVSSDDPAYFGGYVGDNLEQTAVALDLSRNQIVAVVRNSLEAGFVDETTRRGWLAQLERA